MAEYIYIYSYMKILRMDNSNVILPADKGNATVILDKATYTKRWQRYFMMGPTSDQQRPHEEV